MGLVILVLQKRSFNLKILSNTQESNALQMDSLKKYCLTAVWFWETQEIKEINQLSRKKKKKSQMNWSVRIWTRNPVNVNFQINLTISPPK